MRFEKWQALGNDYLIVEESALPFPLTAPRVARLCAAHVGVHSDGVLLIGEPDEPGVAATVRIFNPDGSEAELSGNGVRQALLYLHRDGRDGPVRTAAGIVTPTVESPTTCTVAMGRASTTSKDFPGGPPDGRGEIEGFAFQHVSIGNPQCAIPLADPAQVEALDLPAIGPGIERAAIFPNRTNVSWFAPLAADRIRARIFERGVGETMSSGTGATGAAVAHVLRGGRSPVHVELDGGELTVAVSEDLDVDLTGWAVPVYAGELSAQTLEELRAAQ